MGYLQVLRLGGRRVSPQSNYSQGFPATVPSQVLGSAPDIFIQGLGISIVDQSWMSIQTTLELYNSVDCIRLLTYLVMSALPLQEKDLFECCKWGLTPLQLAFICLLTISISDNPSDSKSTTHQRIVNSTLFVEMFGYLSNDSQKLQGHVHPLVQFLVQWWKLLSIMPLLCARDNSCPIYHLGWIPFCLPFNEWVTLKSLSYHLSV